MTALAAFALHEFETALRLSVGAIALTVEAMGSSVDYYAPRIQEAKGHPGQIEVARILRTLLAGSSLSVTVADQRAEAASAGPVAPDLAQAPYSLRCVPQGLGAMWEAVAQARQIVEREINSVNDNPLIDPVTGEVLYTGNFYGGHIARAMDCLKIDISTLANWLHSVVAMLMDSRFSKGLPNSLTPHSGLHHGLKGLQLSHTSLVTYLRQQSSPSSVHTLPTEQFNQDVVSLGTNAALTTLKMTHVLRDVVSMTLIAAAQAIDLRGAIESLGDGTWNLYRSIRKVVETVDQDRPLDMDVRNLSSTIQDDLLACA
jgi:phenylalanine ammonia-lyase